MERRVPILQKYYAFCIAFCMLWKGEKKPHNPTHFLHFWLLQIRVCQEFIKTAEQTQFLQFLIVIPRCIRKEVFSSKKLLKKVDSHSSKTGYTKLSVALMQ